jgi:ElaB/YqjD/DUF883 family membrane-anchored ribosome-binding protein
MARIVRISEIVREVGPNSLSLEGIAMLNTAELTQQWSTIREKVKERWSHLADDELRLVAGDVEAMITNIANRTGTEREEVERFLRHAADEAADRGRNVASAVVESATGAMRDSISAARDTADELGHQMQTQYENAERFVRARPAESVAGVFATGLLAGVVLGLFLRSEA